MRFPRIGISLIGLWVCVLIALHCASWAAEPNTSSGVKTIVVSPTGEAATIETQRSLQAFQTLRSGSPTEKAQLIQDIQTHSDQYQPPVFYALSQALFTASNTTADKDEAAFWFYAGQLRARYDANRCADISARSAVAVLNEEYGHAINQYSFSDIEKLKQLVPRVVKWDETTPHHYDHRWINLHGMDVMSAALDGDPSKPTPAMSLPQSQWESLADSTRHDYLKGFQLALEEYTRRQKLK